MRFRHAAAWAVLTLLGAAVPGCGSSGTSSTNANNFGWIQSGADYAPPGEGGFNVRWSKQLTDRWESRYLPVELSGAAFDVKRERVYIGTSEGNLFAFDMQGRRRFYYDA